LVSATLQNSVLGLALLVPAFTSISGGNSWPLLGRVFSHLFSVGVGGGPARTLRWQGFVFVRCSFLLAFVVVGSFGLVFLVGLGLLLSLGLCAFVLAASVCKPGFAVPV